MGEYSQTYTPFVLNFQSQGPVSLVLSMSYLVFLEGSLCQAAGSYDLGKEAPASVPTISPPWVQSELGVGNCLQSLKTASTEYLASPGKCEFSSAANASTYSSAINALFVYIFSQSLSKLSYSTEVSWSVPMASSLLLLIFL